MNLHRLFALIRKEFIQIVRDPRTLVIVIAMPVIQLFLLGYAATNDVRDVPLAVWDQDRSPASRALLDAYRASDYFQVAYDIDGEDALRSLIDGGQARAGLIIPPDYADDIAAGRQAQIALVVDGSDPTIASNALSAATMIGQTKATNLLVERAAARGQSDVTRAPVEVRTQVWYNPDLLSAYYMIPALTGLILMVLTMMLTATSIVRERERGTIEQLIVTPLSSFELIVGKVTPYVVIAAFDMLEILVAGMLIFGVPINGSLPLLLALSGLFLTSTLGLGLFISTIANTQQEAMLTAWFFMLPSIFLSGFLFPLASMPWFLKAFSYLIPLRYFLVIVRGIMLKGVGLQALRSDVIALGIFAVVIMGGAVLRFRKRLD
jgi:ABC-2 type transport system permease protein